MKCPNCSFNCPPDFAFCPKCGAEIGAPTAGAPAAPRETLPQRIERLVPAEYAERLLATRGQVRKERRVVTMLFSDVRGSTTMAEHLDPEDWAEIMDGAFEFLIAPIYRYEGTLARLMGDAILAFFGAPIAHEDDPERACRAALEITAEAQRYAEKLEKERGITGFKVRVGINTGLVVVGEAGSDLRVEYAAMGDAINLAQRMESAAEPGTVLITEETHKLIASLFETEALGSIQVKGRTQAVSVYRVLAAKDVAGKVRGIAGLESPLVGREAEFAALGAALDQLEAGVGGIVTLVGEAGIGKSRLVAEVRRVGAMGGVASAVGAIHELPLQPMPPQWVEGRCLSYGHSMAYLLWVDVLRGLVGVGLEDAPEAVGQALQERVQELCPERIDEVYPYLVRLLSLKLSDEEQAKLDELDGQELKACTFEVVETLLDCAARKRPLLVVCEDLHWADPTSMELLEQVLSLTECVPLLLLCVFRPVKDHACWRLRELAAQKHGDRHTDLVLEPLTAAESQTLVANLLAIEDLPEVLRERILSRAEGNPFYVEEVIRSLIDRGAVVRDEASGRWTATREVATIPIPDTLQGVLMARIDRLQEEAKRVLQMASVIGRIFLYRVLAEIAAEERRLDERLATLQREEMIRERARMPELEYIFKHELTREAAYNGLLKRDRYVFHRQVGEALERLFPERVEEQLGLLAYHWERSGDAEKAVHYLQCAGDAARLMYSHAEAIDYYQRALALLKQEEQHEQAARTWMKLGLTYHNAFEYQRSGEAYDIAFALWREIRAKAPVVPPPRAPHALRLPGVPVRTLDPAYVSADPYAQEVVAQLFCGLVELSSERDVVPDLADSWQILEGGSKYVFTLRQDARWSDGTPLAASDFEYAWKRVLDPATKSGDASLLYDVVGAESYHRGDGSRAAVGVRAMDTHTLVIDLKARCGYFLSMLSHPVTKAVPRHVVEAHGDQWTDPAHLVSSGAYMLDVWRKAESMVLVRNRCYHGRLTGNVERVETKLCSGWSDVLGLYECGEADSVVLYAGLGKEDRERAMQCRRSELWTAVWLATAYLAFDVTRPPFDNALVRRAFCLATDRCTLTESVMASSQEAATGGLVPSGMPGHSPGIAVPHDPAMARRLLAEAGHSGGDGLPTLSGLTVAGMAGVVDVLSAQWRDTLGVEAYWDTSSQAWFFDERQSARARIVATVWGADYPDPDSFLRVAVHGTSQWRNETYERLIESARGLTDQDRRMRLYRAAERILIQEAVVLPLFYGRQHMLVKPWVKNYPGPWKDVIIEPH